MKLSFPIDIREEMQRFQLICSFRRLEPLARRRAQFAWSWMTSRPAASSPELACIPSCSNHQRVGHEVRACTISDSRRNELDKREYTRVRVERTHETLLRDRQRQQKPDRRRTEGACSLYDTENALNLKHLALNTVQFTA
ncbi:unnamed protein product [Heligmosomoides polygyrus]|uniref:Uncharacterized protein n=1 Tax=Heligmosomoides polygyrus TaxID=6339 RepID=A0A183GGP3_HELPZ|nr:unnamed protein product [Heligmosomoides polygyrus]